MNIFTAEHPMASQSSWFDTKEHPRLSFLCNTFVLALILAPFLLVRLYYYAISDIGAEPNPFPEPWRCFFMGSVLAFGLSVVCAFPAVLVYRLIARRWRRRNASYRATFDAGRALCSRIGCHRPGARERGRSP